MRKPEKNRRLIAITREPAPTIVNCELTHLDRVPIDYAKTLKEHQNYCQALRDLGLQVVELPHSDFPDGIFVEDPALILDEVAVVTRPGAKTRLLEVPSLVNELTKYRELLFLQPPGTLEGGDILRIDRTLFVGESTRTNSNGIDQLRSFVEPLGYGIVSTPVKKCLHLKTGCSWLGNNTVLVNSDWVDSTIFNHYQVVEIDPREPFSANAICIGSRVLYSSSFPLTARRLLDRGFDLKRVDNSELVKAESGLTCMSLIFSN